MTAFALLVLLLTLVLAARSLLALRSVETPALRAWCRLTLLMVALVLALHFMAAAGTLVLSPEFGVVLVQGGRGARVALGVLLVATGLAAGLGWFTARLFAGRKTPRIAWFVGGGLLAGLAAALRIAAVNPVEAPALQIHRYDLWWPPFLCAVVAGTAAAGWAEVTLRRAGARAAAITGLLALVLVGAAYRPAFVDPTSPAFVRWGMPALLVLWWVLAAWLAAQGRRAVAWMAGGVALGLAAAWSVSPANPGRFESAAQALALAASGPLALTLWRWRVVRRSLAAAAGALTPRHWGVVLGGGLGLAFAAELAVGGRLAPEEALTGWLLGWWMVFESLHAGWAGHLVAHAVQGTLPTLAEPLRATVARAQGAAGGLWDSVLALLKLLFSADSLAVAALKAVAGVLVLVALSELPNAGRTVVATIQTPEEDASFKGAGQDLANHVAASLANLNDELLPDLVLPRGLQPGAQQAQRASSQSASTVEAALAKSGDLKVGPVTIPLGALVAPVQAPMRALLGVRVISGSLHVDRGGFTLLAESSAGRNWRVRVPPDDGLDGDCDPAPANAPAAVKASTPAASAAPAPAASAPNPAPRDVVAQMGDELAFNVRREDPAFAALGLTRSWRAFKCFREGLRHWRRFELTEGVEELAPALRGFREATRIDPAFALAHYRLGLALRSDGQPAQAVESLRASLRASPQFMPATAALASTLWDHDGFAFGTPLADEEGPPADAKLAAQARQAQARELWQALLASPPAESAALDRAAAGYGLCKGSFLRWTQGAEAAPAAEGGPNALDAGVLESYFYCRRSGELQRLLPAPRRAEAVALRVRGLVANVLGQVLDNSGAPLGERRVEGWHCRLEDDDPAAAAGSGQPPAVYTVRPFAKAALRFHRQAVQALPEDAEAGCDMARAAAVLHDDHPMQRLALRAEMHSRLGDELLGGDSLAALQRAQREYRAAIGVDPDALEALNGLANAAWRWRQKAMETEGVPAPDAAMLVEAEVAARRAVGLAAGRTSAFKRIMVRSTLGDILIAQGRHHEAVRELDDALRELGPAAGHAYFHEVWRDLATAALCAAAEDEQAKLDADAPALRARAAAAMAAIEQEERRRAQPVYVRAGAPAPLQPSALCTVADGGTPESVRYAGRQGSATLAHACDRQWVSVRVRGEHGPDLQVELWGSGPRILLPLGEDGSTEPLAFAAPRRNGHRDHFVQLTEKGEARSPRLWLQTSEPAKADDCAGNLLVVDFESRR